MKAAKKLLRPAFTTRQEYEHAIVFIVDGIMHARGADRVRREGFLESFIDEMKSRFPIPTYTIIYANGSISGWTGMDKHVAEVRLAQTRAMGNEAQIEQDGVR